MKKIYILLMHTNTRPSKFIKLMTWYKYSHVAISLERECSTIYSFGRRNPRSIKNSGFSKQRKDGEFFKIFNKTKCKIYEIEVEENKYNNLKQILENMEANANIYKYYYLGVALRYLYIPMIFKNKYVCSYFVADLLQKAEICNFDKKAYFMKPKDFENIKGLNEIYVGDYCLYK